MTLSQHQREFTRHIGKLIEFAYEQGYELTFNEALRTRDQQWLYYHGRTINESRGQLVPDRRKSWTMNSYHLKRLAVDFNLFINGQYQTTTEAHKPLGEYWESLDPLNRWGGRFNDGNHYERRLS